MSTKTRSRIHSEVPTSECPSAYRMALFSAQQLSLEERQQLHLHFKDCPHCQAQLDSKRQSFQEMKQKSGYLTLLQKTQTNIQSQKSNKKKGFWDHLPFLKAPLLTACMLLLLVYGTGYEDIKSPLKIDVISTKKPISLVKSTKQVKRSKSSSKGTKPTTDLHNKGHSNSWKKSSRLVKRAKGNAFSILYLLPGTRRSQRAKEGTYVQPDTLIQFAYKWRTLSYIAVIGIHEKGAITTYITPQQLSEGKNHITSGILPNPEESLQLDSVLGKERFFFVSSSKPIQIHILRKRLRQAFVNAGKKVSSPFWLKGYQAQSLLLEKHKSIPFPPR